ncbi:MAG: succinate dehydrogenase, cytochrome b556 subunit [Nocardioidaceae bacterium]
MARSRRPARAEVATTPTWKARPVVNSPSGTLYRGREGMWSWVAHRITGVLIFFFLFAHVLDTALVRVSPEAYNDIMHTYKNPVVGLLELGLVGAVVFHAFNGLRVVLIDFWSKGPRYQKQLSYGVVGIFVVLMVPFTLRHLMNVFGN